MTIRRLATLALLISCLAVMTPPAVAQTAPQQGYITMTSDPGDVIGQGKQWALSDQTHEFSWQNFTPGNFLLKAMTDEGGLAGWRFTFVTPAGTPFTPGHYTGAILRGLQPETIPGMSIENQGSRPSGCDRLNGSFKVYVAEYDPAGTTTKLALTFEQRCDGGEPALRGEILLGGAVMPDPLPELPVIPKNPNDEAVPGFLNFRSEPGDFILQGKNESYDSRTLDHFLWKVNDRDESVSIFMRNTDGGLYQLHFGTADDSRLTPGDYPHAGRWWDSSNDGPGMMISGNHRGCYAVWGGFTVYVADYAADGTLERFDASFEQRCGSILDRPLRGEIRFGFGPEPPVQPDLPVLPGSFEIQSEPGEALFDGSAASLSTARGDRVIAAANNGYLQVRASDTQNLGMTMYLEVPDGIKPGRYTQVVDSSSQTEGPTFSLARTGGPTCTKLGATFDIHEYEVDEYRDVVKLDLEFESHCGYRSPALMGHIRYGIDEPPAAPTVGPRVSRFNVSTSNNDASLNRSASISEPAEAVRWTNYVGRSLAGEVGPALNVDATNEAGDRWDVRILGGAGESLAAGTHPIDGHEDGKPTLYITGPNNYSCRIEFGNFTIHDVAYADWGGFDRVSATFEGKCNDSSLVKGTIVLGREATPEYPVYTSQPPASIDVRATSSRYGMRISGNVQCPRAGPVTLSGTVFQGSEDFPFKASATCVSGSAAWKGFLPMNSWRYYPGSVLIHVNAVYAEQPAPVLDSIGPARVVPGPR
ncbi:MAG TPA: hypothetical protein VFV09_08700 [Actinomycetota bacterium]|nr:hypothetical protein [Actinomycetota bacterium]